jgi:lipopolysaccharide export system protein LptC
MLKTVLAMFMIAGLAWGQAPKDTSGGADKVDRAAAYYHYTLAHMYAEMATTSGARNREYMNKSIENYKAAVKADPQTPMLLQAPMPLFPFLPLPTARPSRPLPKADPTPQRP